MKLETSLKEDGSVNFVRIYAHDAPEWLELMEHHKDLVFHADRVGIPAELFFMLNEDKRSLTIKYSYSLQRRR